LRIILLLWLITASAVFAIEARDEFPDPGTWVLEADDLRALHANTLESLLRDSPFMRVDSYGGAGLPFLLMSGPWPMDEVLIVVDGLPYRDPWTGEAQVPHLPLALIERLEFSREPEALEFGSAGAAGVLHVTTRRHSGRSARANLHVCPLMIGEPWTTRFSVETPPGGLALAMALDTYDRNLSTFSERLGLPGFSPEITSSQRRALVTRLDLDGASAGPLSFQLVQSSTSMVLSGGPSDTYGSSIYRLSLAAPKTPIGDWRFSQTSIEKSSVLRNANNLSFELRWALRENFMGLEGLSAFAGTSWSDPGWKESGLSTDMGEVNRAHAALKWEKLAVSGFGMSAGTRIDTESGRDAGYIYQAKLSRIFETRPMRIDIFAVGGRHLEAWAHDRFASESLWPNTINAPGEHSARDFLRGGMSLGAYTRNWDWNLGIFGHGAGDRWILNTDDDIWETAPYDAGTSAIFSGRARLNRPARMLDWTLDTVFRLLGGGERRPAGFLEGTMMLERAFGDEASMELAYPDRVRVGIDYLRSIAEGDGHWRISSPLEFRMGPDAETLVRWDLTLELRVLDGRIWWRMRDLLHRGGQEIPGYPMPGREILLGVDWVLFN
jgi:hypothetical protein